MKLELSPQIIEKYSNTIFHENPSSGSGAVPCGQTDIHTYIHTGRYCLQPTRSTDCAQYI